MKLKPILLFAIFSILAMNCSSQTDNVFRNTEHGISFRYNNNWTKQQPQFASTLCLFHEKEIHASCNLSFIEAERNSVDKYDSKYMGIIVNQTFNNARNLKVRFENIAGQKFSISTLDWTYPNLTDDDPIQGKAVIYTTNSKGNRYMMVFTIPTENYELLKTELIYMAGTLIVE